MAAPKKKARKKAAGKALMSVEDIKAKMLAKAEQKEEYLGSGQTSLKISIAGKEFSLGDAGLGDEIEVVILDVCNAKTFYDREYDPKGEDRSSPACYFVGRRKEEDMEPAENSPVKQNDTCYDCEFNEYGSALMGNGKRCSDYRKLVVSLSSDIALEEIATLWAPGKSTRQFDKYAKGLRKVAGLAPEMVITKISFDESEQFPLLNFNMVEPIEDAEHLTNIFNKESEIKELAEEGFDPSNYTPPPEKKTRRAVKKKAVRRR